jgi:hypothetical protein
MKNALFILAFTTLNFVSSAQNGVYLITEVFSGSSTALDIVYVTSPTGVTTTTTITHFLSDPAAHDSQLSIIINSVTSQGYKIFDFGLNHGAPSGNFTRTFFLSQP